MWPWAGKIDGHGSQDNDNLHYDTAKLRQWEIVFAHAQKKGVFLHTVFNEAEEANKRELDDGELGPERKLYYREMIARFGHHLASEWNLCEEYNLNFNFGPERLGAFASLRLRGRSLRSSDRRTYAPATRSRRCVSCTAMLAMT